MQPIVITGLGRTGTSVLARFLQEATDYDLSSEWNPAINAGMELGPVASLNNRISRAFAKTGTIEPDRWADRLCQLARPLFKDPRLCYHEGVLATWHAIFPGLRLIVTHRNVAQCRASRERHASHFRKCLNDRSADAIGRRFADFYAEVLDLDVPHRCLGFPRFVEDFEGTVEAARAVGVKLDPARARPAWDRIVDPSSVHCR